MIYRRLGRTNLKISVISLGGGPYRANDLPIQNVKETIQFAIKKGINFIETAEDYDETKIGCSLEGLKRKNIYIATKSTTYDKNTMKQCILQSLKKLNTDYINIYQLHSVNSEGELDFRVKHGALAAIKEAQKEDLVNFIGISGHHIPTMIKAIKTGEFDMIQIPYNMGHTEAEKLLDVAEKYDVGILAKKVLGGGFLVDPKIPGEKPKKGAESMTIKNAISFVLSNKRISSALIGMKTIEQVKECIKVGEKNIILSEEEKKEITKRVNSFLGDDYCRSCKYCAPCAVHGWKMDIDGILRFEGFYSKYGYNSFKKAYQQLELKGDACTGCRKCEPKCPYGIKISERLKKAHEVLSS